MKQQVIKVKASVDQGGDIDFELNGVKAEQFHLKLPKDSGAHALEFELKDHTKRGLEFDQGDPIWVGEDCPCPPPSGVNSDQLNVHSCTADRLTAHNANEGRARDLRYQLNFKAADGSRTNCDPVITNGGGTKT